MDEITGDDENGSLVGDEDEVDWEEDDDVDFEDQGEDGSPHGGPLDHIARVIGADESFSDDRDGMGVVRVMGDGEEEFFDDEMAPEDEDGMLEELFWGLLFSSANFPADEDEEADYDNDVVYEPELEGLLDSIRRLRNRLRNFNFHAEEDEEDQEMDFGWDVQPPPAVIRAHHHHPHHHHHPRGFNEMFGMLGGADGSRRKFPQVTKLSVQTADAYSGRVPIPPSNPPRPR